MLEGHGDRPCGDGGDREPALVVGDDGSEATDPGQLRRRVGIGPDPHRQPADRPRIAGLDPPGDPADGQQPERPDPTGIGSGHAELLDPERSRSGAEHLDLVDGRDRERRPAFRIGGDREPVAQLGGEVHAAHPRRGQSDPGDRSFVRIEDQEADPDRTSQREPDRLAVRRPALGDRPQRDGSARTERPQDEEPPSPRQEDLAAVGQLDLEPAPGIGPPGPQHGRRRKDAPAQSGGEIHRRCRRVIGQHDLGPSGRFAIGIDDRPGQDDPLRPGRLGQRQQDQRQDGHAHAPETGSMDAVLGTGCDHPAFVSP